jgi:hypothetical protein
VCWQKKVMNLKNCDHSKIKTMKRKSFPSIILFLVTVALFVLLFTVIIPGCSTQKHINTSSASYDSSYVQNLEHDLQTMMEEKSRLESQLHEAEFTTVTFDSTRCPQITFPVNCDNDSIRNLVNQLNAAINGLNNRIKVYSDGSIEYSGKLNSYKFSKDVQSNIIASQENRITQLEHSLDSSNAHVRTETKTVDKVVKKKFMPGFAFWLYLVAFILGCVFWWKFGSKIIAFF